jgi:hypothetical protein
MGIRSAVYIRFATPGRLFSCLSIGLLGPIGMNELPYTYSLTSLHPPESYHTQRHHRRARAHFPVKPASQPASHQPASQPASQSVSQPASQPVSQPASQSAASASAATKHGGIRGHPPPAAPRARDALPRAAERPAAGAGGGRRLPGLPGPEHAAVPVRACVCAVPVPRLCTGKHTCCCGFRDSGTTTSGRRSRRQWRRGTTDRHLYSISYPPLPPNPGRSRAPTASPPSWCWPCSWRAPARGRPLPSPPLRLG